MMHERRFDLPPRRLSNRGSGAYYDTLQDALEDFAREDLVDFEPINLATDEGPDYPRYGSRWLVLAENNFRLDVEVFIAQRPADLDTIYEVKGLELDYTDEVDGEHTFAAVYTFTPIEVSCAAVPGGSIVRGTFDACVVGEP